MVETAEILSNKPNRINREADNEKGKVDKEINSNRYSVWHCISKSFSFDFIVTVFN